MTVAAATTDASPWLADASTVAVERGTDTRVGLTAEEAARRLAEIGPNRLDAAAQVPAWRKLLAQFEDPLVYLLLAAVAISLVTWVIDGTEGAPFEAIVIAVILIANALLGYMQEARAEQAVAALQRMTAVMSTVVRDGVAVRVPADELVPGDLLALAEGDAVSADGRLVEAATLMIAEASLTGESEPVLKDAATLTGDVALGDRLNMVFSGTAVTRGRGRAVVDEHRHGDGDRAHRRSARAHRGRGDAAAARDRPRRPLARHRRARHRRRS